MHLFRTPSVTTRFGWLPKHLLRHLALIAALGLVGSVAQAAPPTAADAAEVSHMSVHLEGRKIGRFETRRQQTGSIVTTRQLLDIEIRRDQSVLRLVHEEQHVESAEGAPLSFRVSSDLGGSQTVTEGSLRGDTLIARRNGTAIAEQPWPTGAALAEGQRLASAAHLLLPGTRFDILTFDTSSLAPLATTVRYTGFEDVLAEGGKRALLHATTELHSRDPGVSLLADSYLDPDSGEPLRISLPLAGLKLEMIACDKACANAPNESTDLLRATLVPAPQAISLRKIGGPLHFVLQFHGRADDAARQLAAQSGQSITADSNPDDGRVTLNRGRAETATRGSRDDPADPRWLASTRWIEAADPAIRDAAARATRGVAARPRKQLEALQAFVANHVSEKSLDVGYASAAETLRARTGDCTEHAVLLAALARAQGIPARIVTGIAFAPAYLGERDVFVPHAWIEAAIDGRWQTFDAALPPTHPRIAFTNGDGDPLDFFAGNALLGGFKIDAVEFDPKPAATPR